MIKEILILHEAEDADTVKENYSQFENLGQLSKDILEWMERDEL